MRLISRFCASVAGSLAVVAIVYSTAAIFAGLNQIRNFSEFAYFSSAASVVIALIVCGFGSTKAAAKLLMAAVGAAFILSVIYRWMPHGSDTVKWAFYLSWYVLLAVSAYGASRLAFGFFEENLASG